TGERGDWEYPVETSGPSEISGTESTDFHSQIAGRHRARARHRIDPDPYTTWIRLSRQPPTIRTQMRTGAALRTAFSVGALCSRTSHRRARRPAGRRPARPRTGPA